MNNLPFPRADVLGPASFVVMDTDYDSYALLCTCQQKDILFITFHRRSCTILQREPVPDPAISRKLRALLNEKIGSPSDSEKPDHDFDRIDHSTCNYADDGKGLQIDVDKILGAAKEEVCNLGGFRLSLSPLLMLFLYGTF